MSSRPAARPSAPPAKQAAPPAPIAAAPSAVGSPGKFHTMFAIQICNSFFFFKLIRFSHHFLLFSSQQFKQANHPCSNKWQLPPVSVHCSTIFHSLYSELSSDTQFRFLCLLLGGVAVGSAIGHTMGHAMTGLFSGGSDSQEAAPAPVSQAAPIQQEQQSQGQCAWEISQFLKCSQEQNDLTLCQGFNEAMRQCKERYAPYN